MQSWVDFAAIKQSVPLAPLLRRYQVKLRRTGRDQYRGCCPIHGGEGHDAFHANLTRNVFHCFACGAHGTVLDFVAAMDRCSVREAALKLACVMAEPTALATAPACSRQLVTKKPALLRRLASRCAAWIQLIRIWRPVVLRIGPPCSLASVSIAARESSPDAS